MLIRSTPVRFVGPLAALVLLLSASAAVAGQVSCQLSFAVPQVAELEGYHRISLSDAWRLGEPGEPYLPAASVWLLLPPGEKAVSAELRGQVWGSVPGRFRVEPAPEPRRLSDPTPPPPVQPNPRIYDNDAPYPVAPVGGLATHLKRGWAVGTCLIWPVRWNPVSGAMEYLSQGELFVRTEPGDRERSGFDRFYRGDRRSRDWVQAKVRNPDAMGFYPRRDTDEPETMLLLTDEAFMDPALEYASWRDVRGLRTYVVDCDEFLGGVGIDPQDRIRNGIIAAYDDWNIGYVLLLGDDEQIPHRGLYGVVQDEIDNDIPADWYYSALDGNWNDDGDARWGELNEADLFAEVAVGRIPAGTAADAERGLNKVRLYSDAPVVDDVLKVLMVGEELGWQMTGADYMDEVYAGGRYNGYATEGYPERFDPHRRNLYDRDVGEWSGVNDLAPLISQGYHMIHHLGHAYNHAVMRLHRLALSDNLITNDGVDNGLNIAYSQGCYAGAFDNRDTEGADVGDCVAERFIAELSNGFAAFLCNSRYGWGSGDNTDGASQRFHREFVDAIFDEQKTAVGRTNQDSKEDVEPIVQYSVYLWCFYQINLMGDPAMDIWTDVPAEFEQEDIDYPGALMLGEESYSLSVTGMEGVTVCLSRDGEMLAVGITDENGDVDLFFDEPVHSPEPIDLTVVAHNYLPFRTVIQVTAPDLPFPWIEGLEIDEVEGNKDSRVDYGETVELSPLVHNIGGVTLSGLNLTASSSDRMVNIVRRQAEYPDLEADDEVIPTEPLLITVDPGCRDMHRVRLTLDMEDVDHRTWYQDVTFIVHAPEIGENQLTVIDDDGNGNGRLDPGEQVYVQLLLTNAGSGVADELVAELATESPVVEMLLARTTRDELLPLEQGVFDAPFRLRVSGECPNPYRAVFYVRVSAQRGFYRSILIDQEIGGAAHLFPDGEPMWDHDSIGVGQDQWHISPDVSHTPDGSGCLKVGDQQEGDEYGRFLNCVAYLPEFEASGPVELSFWHRIDAECRSDTNLAFDGGFVEASIDGENWETILPELTRGRGYPCEILHGQSLNPLEDGQPCWSGSREWEPAVFDLSDFEGETVRVRFRFGSDETVQRSGWYIDDVRLRAWVELEGPYDLDGEMTARGAHLWWHSPELSRDDLRIANQILGYRIYRGPDILDTLVTDNSYFDDLVGMPRGRYEYLVVAEYTTGVSYASNILELEWEASAPMDAAAGPLDWSLDAPHPNPFNRSVQIAYTVPASGMVTLTVFDLNGRAVAELERGFREPGTYRIHFNAGELPSGVYVVRMNCGDGVKAAKMVLMR